MNEVYRPIAQPVRRNALRQKLGVAYFRLKKRLQWAFGNIKFGRQNSSNLPYEYFNNASPLLRNLAGIDPVLEQNKIVNLRIALSKINGVVLQPNEVFSFWKMIGKPTRHKGYVDGVILTDGSFSGGLGGGLCHLSGVIYWATLHTPLDVIERHRHGYDTTPQKFFGHDATCFYNYKDLMIKNNTGQAFQLQIEITDDELVAVWKSDIPPNVSYEIYEKAGCFHVEDWGATTRHNRVYRKTFDQNGVQINDEFISENHAIVM
ncbi:MAG: VanW family protein [Defluviitaleaceae bacterium]|nr:VanW family protein [Defluviitaleaceae bacterium]